MRSLADEGLSLDEGSVEAATEDVKSATDELIRRALADLERPETEAGEQARSELDELGTQLRQQLDEIEQPSRPARSLVTVTAALATAAATVSSTFETLQSLDSGEELRDGFEMPGPATRSGSKPTRSATE